MSVPKRPRHLGAHPARMGSSMPNTTPMQGELQHQIMAALWRLGEGTVEAVRSELPAGHRGAYNTVQTVLNRLAERGMLTRRKDGRGLAYRPVLNEAEYLSRSMEHTLAGATPSARQAALAALLGGMDPKELDAVRKRARQAAKTRAV